MFSQIKIPAREREKLNEWKEMAKNVENNLGIKKNERNKHLREQIHNAELKMEVYIYLALQENAKC